MFNVLKLNEISDQATKALGEGYAFTVDKAADADAIILRSFKMHDFETGKSLKAVARAGAGVNNIPLDKMTEKNIVVFNTPGANANAVKELVICAMLLASRKVVESINWLSTQKDMGAEVPGLVEKNKSMFTGPEILGKTAGVVSLGAIGSLVAKAAANLGMNVIGYDPYLSADAAAALGGGVEMVESLDEIYAKSDYITLQCPLTADTKGMINADTIAKMKDGVKIINCARGELVNNADILAAIKSGKVAKYATDFPTAELLCVENVIAIPHLGASTPEAEDNCAMMAAMQLKDYLENGNIKNSVNYPAAYLARSSQYRLTITHKNIANMIAAATNLFGENNINISNMLSASKGDLAYMIIDVDSPVSEAIVDKLKEIEGFLQVNLY